MNVEYFVEASAALSRNVRTELKLCLYLYGHFNDIDLFQGNGAPRSHGAIIHILQSSLRCQLILRLSDYVYYGKNDDRGIFKLLAFAESNLDIIPWKVVPPRSSLREQRERLDEIKLEFAGLLYVRNKYFAHIDSEYVIDPDKELGKIVPTVDEMFVLLNTIVSILNFLDRHLGRLPGVGYDAWYDAECKQFTEKLLGSMSSRKVPSRLRTAGTGSTSNPVGSTPAGA